VDGQVWRRKEEKGRRKDVTLAAREQAPFSR